LIESFILFLSERFIKAPSSYSQAIEHPSLSKMAWKKGFPASTPEALHRRNAVSSLSPWEE